MHKRYQHTEALPDEAFVINVRVGVYLGGRLIVSFHFGREKWKTKRLGGIAYDCKGNRLDETYRPMFVKKEEVESMYGSLDVVDALTASYWR